MASRSKCCCGFCGTTIYDKRFRTGLVAVRIGGSKQRKKKSEPNTSEESKT